MALKEIEKVPDGTLVGRYSCLSGTYKTRILPMDYMSFLSALDRWDKGMLLQDAFPKLSKDDREFLLTGITPEEWNEKVKG